MIKTKITESFGIKYPILSAPMGPFLDYVIEHTDKPFGVNIRTARVQTDHKIMLRKIAQLSNTNPKIREQLIYLLTSAGGARNASKILKQKAPHIMHYHVSPALWLVDKVYAKSRRRSCGISYGGGCCCYGNAIYSF
jgi:hypothetical protein